MKRRGKRFLLFERNVPGGLCRTNEIDGFRFDRGGHFIHSKSDYVRNFVRYILPDIEEHKRKAYIYFRNRLIPYPIQSNLPGMRFEERLFSTFSYMFRGGEKKLNLESSFYKTFGRFLSEKFFIPYNSKLWQYPLNYMTTNGIGRYIPKPNLFGFHSDSGYNPVFLFPRRGIGELTEKLSNDIKWNKGELREIRKGKVKIGNNTYKYKKLVLTIPLPDVIKLLAEEDSGGIKEKLRYVSIMVINIGFDGYTPVPFHWVYFPDERFPFIRAGSFSNISSSMAPDGYSSLWLEVPFTGRKPINIIDDAIDMLISTGIVKGKVIFSSYDILEYAYVIFDREREGILKKIKMILDKYNIILAGRFAEWEYTTMGYSIQRGKELAEKI